MTYDLSIQKQIKTDLPVDRLRQAVKWVLRRHNVAPKTGISVVIGDDEEIRNLNRQFRAIDAPTDVLSFPAGPVLLPEEVAAQPYLGDLALSLPYIQRQAEAEGHSLSDELTLAVIHGTLHLLGYDHDTAEHQAAMWAAQDEALRAMKVDIVVPEFDFTDEE